jgi:H+/Cl- antiporter ClcA
LFSGEEQSLDLIAHAAEIGVVMLIVLGLVKLFATSLLLATGWKGGYIFPLMFTSIALGLAVDLMFPGIPIAVAVVTSALLTALVALRTIQHAADQSQPGTATT